MAYLGINGAILGSLTENTYLCPYDLRDKITMNTKQNFLYGAASAISHSILVPIFAFVFVILYRPFSIPEILQMDGASYSFNITILLCIVFGSVALMRLILFLLRKKFTDTGLVYAIWCLGEVVVASLFASLYTTLMLDGQSGYFEVVGAIVGRLFGICIYPYGIIYLIVMLLAERVGEEQVDSASLMKFYDEYKKLRFVIASEAVIFLRSEENYVQIHYLDHSKPKKFVLRSSMRALEEQMERHGLVRCHRSYFINPDHIKMIRKEPSGVVSAELKQEGFEPIPISRKYQQEVTKLL